jgi:hypothetical protein
MAVIAGGQVLLEGAPNETLATLAGRIFTKFVASQAEMTAVGEAHTVVSTQLSGGRHEVRIYAESDPGEGFVPVEQNLEDVYFLTIKGPKPAIAA